MRSTPLCGRLVPADDETLQRLLLPSCHSLYYIQSHWYYESVTLLYTVCHTSSMRVSHYIHTYDIIYSHEGYHHVLGSVITSPMWAISYAHFGLDMWGYNASLLLCGWALWAESQSVLARSLSFVFVRMELCGFVWDFYSLKQPPYYFGGWNLHKDWPTQFWSYLSHKNLLGVGRKREKE